MSLSFSDHLLTLPILVPMLCAALSLMLGNAESRRDLRVGISSVGIFANFVVALLLFREVQDSGSPPVLVYLVGNWPSHFGITLVADSLSVLMIMLSALIAVPAFVYSLARWERLGLAFHGLFHLQLMGLNGAFLTGDLFNLFVFFEVLLAASYGLLLHGSGRERIRAGLHYVAINLVASSLLLFGIAVIYGVTGSLNLADIADTLYRTPSQDRGLLRSGVAVFAVALLIKAGIWPLNLWLGRSYASASAPVACLFGIMTKVGVYAVLRLWVLIFPVDGLVSPMFGAAVLRWGGVLTLCFATLGFLASYRIDRLAGFAVIATAGTLLGAVGFGGARMTGNALFYLIASTLAASTLYLIVELVERHRSGRRDTWARYDTGMHDDRIDALPFFGTAGRSKGRGRDGEVPNLDEQGVEVVGLPFAGGMMFLAIAFLLCALMIAGMPPMSSFVAKFGLLRELARLDPIPGTGGTDTVMFGGLLILSGLAALIGMARAGARCFWAAPEKEDVQISVLEGAPVVLLLVCAVSLTVFGQSALSFTTRLGEQLGSASHYVGAVHAARPVPRRMESTVPDPSASAPGAARAQEADRPHGAGR